jgi:hypothetical protein
VTADWLRTLNSSARSLGELYRDGVTRDRIYDEMTEEILGAVRRGSRVCVAFYGHPGVFVTPSHAAIEQARAEGFPARMLPAISAEDCLIADLGVDPGEQGWQSYEATDLLLRRYCIEPTAALVVWQVDGIGKLDWDPDPASDPHHSRGLRELAEFLLELYPEHHDVVFYTASLYPIVAPTIARVPLSDVAGLAEAPCPTLYVPPLPRGPIDAEAARRLGITLS